MTTPNPKKSIEVPLSPDDMVALTEMAVADFRRPAQMAAKLLHEAIATALNPPAAPKSRAHRRKATPVAIAQDDIPAGTTGSIRLVSGANMTDTVVTTTAAGRIGGTSPAELPYDKGGVFTTGDSETARYAAGGVVVGFDGDSRNVADSAAVLVTGPDPAGYGDEAADPRPDRPDLRAQHHGYGQRVIADVPQA